MRDYYVKFYSNDPAFVYTFAHAFIKNDLFIEDLTPKMSKESVKNVAKEKNPKNLVGYVKSLFFAYLLIGDYGLFSKTLYNHNAEKYNKTKLLKLIEHADDKIKARQEAEEKQKKTQQREKNNSERFDGRNNKSKNSSSSKLITKTKVVNRTGTVKKVGRIKKV